MEGPREGTGGRPLIFILMRSRMAKFLLSFGTFQTHAACLGPDQRIHLAPLARAAPVDREDRACRTYHARLGCCAGSLALQFNFLAIFLAIQQLHCKYDVLSRILRKWKRVMECRSVLPKHATVRIVPNISQVMGLSDLFVDPSDLPEDGYGFVQLVFLMMCYGYVLATSSNWIADGSEQTAICWRRIC